jgi:hypothetical protein
LWYRQGINPQIHLPHLAAYLGHRDIHSTLVYLTITQELLQSANERFRTAEADVVKKNSGKIKEGKNCSTHPSETAALVFSRVACRTKKRLAPDGLGISGRVASFSALRVRTPAQDPPRGFRRNFPH